MSDEDKRGLFAGVKHVVFDLYGTLVDIRTDEDDPAVWTQMAEWLKPHGATIEPENLHLLYKRVVASMEKNAGGDAHEAHPEIDIEDVFAAMLGAMGVKASKTLTTQTAIHFRALTSRYIRLYDGAKALLAVLRKAGKGVYLLSNAQALFTRAEIGVLGLADCFDAIYLSSDCRVKKPDVRFFEKLLTDCEIDPKEAVMIGNDGGSDIAGARALGMKTIYIKSNISPVEPLPQADVVLEQMDLPQVQRLLLGEEE